MFTPIYNLSGYSILHSTSSVCSKDSVSLCSRSWPGTHYADQADFCLYLLCAGLKGVDPHTQHPQTSFLWEWRRPWPILFKPSVYSTMKLVVVPWKTFLPKPWKALWALQQRAQEPGVRPTDDRSREWLSRHVRTSCNVWRQYYHCKYGGHCAEWNKLTMQW